MKKLVKIILSAMAVGMAVWGCSKEGNDTIVFLGYENYIPEIENVVPDSLLKIYKDSIGDFSRGYIPPNIEGTYVVSPKKRVLSNNLVSWPLEVIEPDLRLTFSGQHNGVAILDFSEATENHTDTVYVMGRNQDFTVYFKEIKPFEYEGYHVEITRAIIMTGSVDSLGIRNLSYANIILDILDGSDGLIEQYPIGQYFIYKDGDGLSNRQP